MLRQINQYGAAMAKIRVMKSRMLTAADYRELMNRRSVTETAAYLKQNTCYNKTLANVDVTDIHRDRLELLLHRDLLWDFRRIYQFENGEGFYSYFFIKEELEHLKLLLRMIDTGSTDAFPEIDPFLKKHFSVDFDLLQTSASIREFLQNVRGSRYERILAPHLRMEEHQNLFSIEMALDIHYFNLMSAMSARLKNKTDRRLAAFSLGSEGDLLNLLWIYRCKAYFAMPKEMIYSYIIPNRCRLTDSDIRELVEAPSEKALRERIQKTPYRRAFDDTGGPFFEQSYYRFVYDMHRELFRRNPYSIMAVVSYIHLKEIEIKNITSIVEGVRYGLLPEEIEKYVVGYPAKA